MSTEPQVIDTVQYWKDEFSKFMDRLKKSGIQYNFEKIESAYEYANAMHEGQFRQSGEPYISHPIAVAEIVADLHLDTDSICAALLHDTVEDCADKTNLSEIQKRFGDTVADLVDGLTKIVTLHIEDKEEAHIENLRKMILAMNKDIRVIFIKLCDRLHNMRTLGAKNEEKQRIISLETMQVYAPLAHRLGMQKVKQELENLGLFYLDPVGYAEISNHIESKYGNNKDFIERIRARVTEKLNDYHMRFDLEGRIKTVYSIYKKMYSQNKSFDEIYDFYALRILVDSELECYQALGIIHEMFKSIPGRFKDYISMPKPNLYRSLHTTVIGSDGIPFEVQIRTHEMHEVAEYGIAAHWKYKSGEKANADTDKKLEWIARLVETEDTTNDPDEFMAAIKTDVFHDETFIFTPKGDVISLPYGSTVIDFAYAIHSAVGNRMVGAKINGMIVPIDKVPNNGEIVEIITSSTVKGPSRDWLNIVKTSEARSKIRAWFKKEKKDDNIILGRQMVEQEFKSYNRSYTDEQFAQIVDAVSSRNGFTSAEDMFNTLGYGGIPFSKLVSKFKDEFNRVIKPIEEPSVEIKTVKSLKKSGNGNGIIVEGHSGCAVKFARCCNPLPGDKIIGFVTMGFGVSVHKAECSNVELAKGDPDKISRLVKVEWETSDITKHDIYESTMKVHSEDALGVMADIAAALRDLKVSILKINTQTYQDGSVLMYFTIGSRSTEHFNSIMSKIRTIKHVIDVSRG